MIYIEQKDGFLHTYSVSFFIRKIGTDEIYTDAMDVTAQQYEETETPLPTTEPTETEMREALNILGVIL